MIQDNCKETMHVERQERDTSRVDVAGKLRVKIDLLSVET